MLSDFQLLVEKAVRDDSSLITADDIDAAIALAVSRYSLDRPQYVVEDLEPTGLGELILPDLWEQGFSSIISLEYPIGSFPAKIVDSEAYAIYQSPTGHSLRLLFTPTETVRATYSIAHVLSYIDDTIPANHREAVTCWAAAYCLDQLAAFAAGVTDATIQAGRVDRGSQTRDYAQRANALRIRYVNELGIEEKKAVAAGVVVNLDLKNSVGQDRLTHPNRFR